MFMENSMSLDKLNSLDARHWRKLCILLFQSLKFSKVLIREAEKELLHRVNKEECRVLVERWQSNECMNAIMNFFQQKSSSKL